MNKFAYFVIGGAALAWGGCSDLPSFPANLGQGGGAGSSTNTTGGSSVIPNAGTSSSTAGTSSSTAGTSSSTAGTGNNAGTSSGGSGTAGDTATGGTGGSGTAGDTTNGGSGGTGPNPQAEIDDAVKNLKGWRYENPCGYVDGHSLTDGQCNSGEICWPDSNKARFAEKKVIQIGGVAGHNYDVTLRVRGALEPRDYPADCQFVQGEGSANGATVSVIENCDGFANGGQVTFNVFELKITQPPHVYYMNGVKSHPPHRVDAMDQQFTIRVAGGTTINFSFDDLNGGEIRNCSITVEGIQPYPKIFDGNFFQLDVVDAKLAQ
jgi:hypothetical protein